MKDRELRSLLGPVFYTYSDEDWLDPRSAFESALVDRADELPAALEQWRALKGDPVSEADYEAFHARLDLPWVEPVEGTSFRRWLEWAEARIVEVVEHPGTLRPEDRHLFHPRLFREGAFRDEGSEPLLVQDLIVRHEAEVEAWLADPDAGLRLHLVADVGWRVGDALELGRSRGSTEVLQRTPTRRGAVALLRTPGADLPMRTVAAYPVEPCEPAGAPAVRQRWPQLEQVFGGYFGQHGARWQWPWGSQRALLMDEPPAFLAVVRRQLPEMLALDDAAFHHALSALGCYVDAPDTRGWVERMLWRMDAFDWS